MGQNQYTGKSLVLKAGASQAAAVTIAHLSAMGWKRKRDMKPQFVCGALEPEVFTTGDYMVEGKFTVKGEVDEQLTTYIQNSGHLEIPYMAAVLTPVSGAAKTATFQGAMIGDIDQADIKTGADVAERTYNFVAKNVAEA